MSWPNTTPRVPDVSGYWCTCGAWVVSGVSHSCSGASLSVLQDGWTEERVQRLLTLLERLVFATEAVASGHELPLR